jgi:hypothetical protein
MTRLSNAATGCRSSGHGTIYLHRTIVTLIVVGVHTIDPAFGQMTSLALRHQ